MSGKWLSLSLIVATCAVVGCGNGDDSSASATCGAGTVQQGSVCMVLGSDGGPNVGPDGGAVTTNSDGGAALTCGAGTVQSGSTCIVGPGPTISKARLTYLNVKYDTTKPVLLNNPVPIEFGITSNSANPNVPATTAVNVLFSFVQTGASDGDGGVPTCSSNGLLLNLVGNGVEQKFTADIYPTNDCTFAMGAGATVNLAIDFDQSLRLSGTPTTIDYPPVVFSAANASAPDNALCAGSKNTGTPNKGCVYSLALQPPTVGGDGKPMINIKFDSLKPQSSVAILPPAAPDPEQRDSGAPESDEPLLVVNAAFVLNGRDPYHIPIDTSALSPAFVASDPDIVNLLSYGLSDGGAAELDDLPTGAGGGAPATVKYDIVPTNQISPTAWMPLTIDDPKNPNPDGHVSEIDLTTLDPGTENDFTHQLFIEGPTLTAVTGNGPWANQNNFTIRGCLIANFAEDQDPGEEDPENVPAGGDVPTGDCQTFQIVLVKSPTPTTSGVSESFDMTWTRTVGNPSVLALSGTLGTANSLDLTGARTNSTLSVNLNGHVGTDFNVELLSAFAKAGALATVVNSYVDVGVNAFGNNVFGYQNTANMVSYSQDFMVAKSFSFPTLGYGFGPVSVGITFGVGGNIGLTPAFTVTGTQGPGTDPALSAATVSGTLQATVTPNAGLTGTVSGGIDLLLASAQVVATVQIVNISTPVQANLLWGVTQGSSDAVTQMTVLGNVNWNLNITWLNTSVDLVGTLGRCFFCVSRTVNLFKYENPGETINLLNRALPGALVLQ